MGQLVERVEGHLMGWVGTAVAQPFLQVMLPQGDTTVIQGMELGVGEQVRQVQP